MCPSPRCRGRCLVAQVLTTRADVPHPRQFEAAAVARGPRKALVRGALPEAAAVLQQRACAELGDPRGCVSECRRLQSRAACVVATLQRELHFEDDDAVEAAHVIARGAGELDSRGAVDVLLRRRGRVQRAAAGEVGVVGVAEAAPAHRGKATGRQAAAVFLADRDGVGGGGPRGARRTLGQVPAAVMRIAQRVLIDRSRAAPGAAAYGQLERFQRPRTGPDPLLDVGLVVLAPLLGVRDAQVMVTLDVVGAATGAATDRAQRAEQHAVARFGHVDVDAKLGPDRVPQQRAPRPGLWCRRRDRDERGHVSDPTTSSTPACSSSARSCSGEAWQ